jgi:hypothetical protein
MMAAAGRQQGSLDVDELAEAVEASRLALKPQAAATALLPALQGASRCMRENKVTLVQTDMAASQHTACGGKFVAASQLHPPCTLATN